MNLLIHFLTTEEDFRKGVKEATQNTKAVAEPARCLLTPLSSPLPGSSPPGLALWGGHLRSFWLEVLPSPCHSRRLLLISTQLKRHLLKEPFAVLPPRPCLSLTLKHHQITTSLSTASLRLAPRTGTGMRLCSVKGMNK